MIPQWWTVVWIVMHVGTACSTADPAPDAVAANGCPLNYVKVPAHAVLGTSAFCIMKYEAKMAGGLPISVPYGNPASNLSQTTAKNRCLALGANARLPTNADWMALTLDLAATGSNWSGGGVGVGAMNRGHSDAVPPSVLAAPENSDDPCFGTGEGDCLSASFSQKRTHTLSTGEVIWDVAGNLSEWIDWNLSTGKPTPNAEEWIEYSTPVVASDEIQISAIRPVAAIITGWSDSWSSQQGLGQYYPGVDSSGGAALRGGSWAAGERSGLFALNLVFSVEDDVVHAGFRCAWSVP